MKRFYIFVTCVLTMVGFSLPTALAYHNQTTHPALTEAIVDFYNLQQSPSNQITSEQKEWMIEGSKLEDTVPRWINHFYDPVHHEAWNGAHVIDQNGNTMNPSDVLKYATAGFNFTPLAAPDWLVNTDAQNRYGNYGGNQSWPAALGAYAQNDEKTAFTALGYDLHLLEDMAVPDHTRNDTHAALPVLAPTDNSPYEDYASKWNPDTIKSLNIPQTLKNQNKGFYSFGTPEEFLKNLATYSNKYFFSKDTINDPYFPSPQISEKDCSGNFCYGKDENGNKILLSWIDYAVAGNKIATKYSLDNTTYQKDILQSYFDHLAPEAVRNGAGMIQLFMQKGADARVNYEMTAVYKVDKTLTNTASYTFSPLSTAVSVGTGIANVGGAIADGAHSLGSAISNVWNSAVGNLFGPKEIFQSSATVSAAIPTNKTVPQQPPTAPMPTTPIEPLIVPPTPVAPKPQPILPTIAVSAKPENIETTKCAYETFTGHAKEMNVIFNEIAWMGTKENSSNEWFELKNTTDVAQDISQWHVADKNNDIAITIPKNTVIAPNSYFLFERTSDNTVPGIKADLIYSGSIANTNETLRLLNAQCEIVDDVAANPTWEAGSANEHRTMERTQPPFRVYSMWQTSSKIDGTPRAENSLPYAPTATTNSQSSATNAVQTHISGGASVALPASDPTPTAVISEIMYNPKGSDTNREWIEIHNIGTVGVISEEMILVENGTRHAGVIIKGSASFAPGDYMVLAKNPETFLAEYPDFSGTVMKVSFSLSNTGKSLSLAYKTTPIDSIIYEKSQGGYDNGDSLQLQSDGAWKGALPSPGKPNNEPVVTFTEPAQNAQTETPNETSTVFLSSLSETSTELIAENSTSTDFLASDTETSTEIALAEETQPALLEALEFGADFDEKSPALILSWQNQTDAYRTKYVLTATIDDEPTRFILDATSTSFSYLIPQNEMGSSFSFLLQAQSEASALSDGVETSFETPAIAFTSATNVTISEILFNATGADEGKEFIELYNPTDAAISLANYSLERITNEKIYSIVTLGSKSDDQTTIPAHGFLLIGLNNYAATNWNGVVADVMRSASLPDGTNENTIELLNENDETVDEITYSKSSIDVEGSSLERRAWNADSEECVSPLAGEKGELLGNGCAASPSSYSLIIRKTPQPQNSQSTPEPRETLNENNVVATYDSNTLSLTVSWQKIFGATNYLLSIKPTNEAATDYETADTTKTIRIKTVGAEYTITLKAFANETEIDSYAFSKTIPSLVGNIAWNSLNGSNLGGNSLLTFDWTNYPIVNESLVYAPQSGQQRPNMKAIVVYLNTDAAKTEILGSAGPSGNTFRVSYSNPGSPNSMPMFIFPDAASVDRSYYECAYFAQYAGDGKETVKLPLSRLYDNPSLSPNDYITLAFYGLERNATDTGGITFKLLATDATHYQFTGKPYENKKPNAPTAIQAVWNPDWSTLTITGATATDADSPSNLLSYESSIDGGATWNSKILSLTPETTYQILTRAIDEYGAKSEPLITNYTTPAATTPNVPFTVSWGTFGTATPKIRIAYNSFPLIEQSYYTPWEYLEFNLNSQPQYYPEDHDKQNILTLNYQSCAGGETPRFVFTASSANNPGFCGTTWGMNYLHAYNGPWSTTGGIIEIPITSVQNGRPVESLNENDYITYGSFAMDYFATYAAKNFFASKRIYFTK